MGEVERNPEEENSERRKEKEDAFFARQGLRCGLKVHRYRLEERELEPAVFPDRKDEAQAHIGAKEKADGTGQRDVENERGDMSQDDDGGADENASGEDRVGEAVGDRIESFSERFEALGVDFVFEGDVDIAAFDASVESAKIVREFF